MAELDSRAAESRRNSGATPAREAWFTKDAAFDAGFHDRFRDLHFAAARRELDHWIGHPESALALMILLDQFPRNCFRGTGHMYRDRSAGALFRPEGAGGRARSRSTKDCEFLPAAVRALREHWPTSILLSSSVRSTLGEDY